MRVLITGGDGQLGKSLRKIITENYNKYQSDDFTFTVRSDLDFSSMAKIDHYFSNNGKFDVIINCAAYTAVDMAEKERDIAKQVNCLAVKRLSEIANKCQSKLIHISTDYVFDGEDARPYSESDPKSPVNFYGYTKLCADEAIQEVMPVNAVIVRSGWVFSEYGGNFVNTMLDLASKGCEIDVVDDQVGSPTYATDLAMVILLIMHQMTSGKKTQVYHYSNSGKCSWYEFAREIFKTAGVDCKVNQILTKEYPTWAVRPKNTWLSKKKIMKEYDINLPTWKESLKKCLLLIKT